MLDWFISLAIATGAILVIHTLTFIVLGIVVRRTRPNWDNLAVSRSRWPSLLVVLLATLLVWVRGWEEVSDEDEGKIRQALRVLLICALMWWGFRVVDSLFAIALTEVYVVDEETNQPTDVLSREYRLAAQAKQASRDAHRHSIETKLVVVKRLMVCFIAFLGTISILGTYSQLQHVAAFVLLQGSLIALVVGLAAKDLISGLVANVIVAFTQPIRIGDMVELHGEFGVVEKIAALHVGVRVWTGQLLVVPMVDIVTQKLVNWSKTPKNGKLELLGFAFVWVDYKMPMEPLRQEFLRFLETCEYYDDRVATVAITDSTDVSKQVRFLFSASNDPINMWRGRNAIREHMISFMAREFPSMLPRKREEHLKSE